MKQNDVKTHYKKPKHDLFIPKFTGDEELHFDKETDIIKSTGEMLLRDKIMIDVMGFWREM